LIFTLMTFPFLQRTHFVFCFVSLFFFFRSTICRRIRIQVSRCAVDIMRFPPPRPALSPSLHLPSPLSPRWRSDRSRWRRVPKPMTTCSAIHRNIHSFSSPSPSRFVALANALQPSPLIDRCPRRVHPRCPPAISTPTPVFPAAVAGLGVRHLQLVPPVSLLPQSHSAPFKVLPRWFACTHCTTVYVRVASDQSAYVLHLARAMDLAFIRIACESCQCI
jgi:hypothetical protein